MNVQTPVLVAEDGTTLDLDVERYADEPPMEEIELLGRVGGPVIDVGCGAGRHVLALLQRGVSALGIDPSPQAAAMANVRGAPVLQRSVFDPLPGLGRWESALLFDGNIGIGGSPLFLLARVRELLRPGGTLIAELSAPHTPSRTMRVRIVVSGEFSRWFDWSVVSAADVRAVADEAGFSVQSIQNAGDRWFAVLVARATG
jgi:SAM-dependent methyltransferase